MDGPGVEIGGKVDEWLRSAAEGLEYVDVVDGKGIGGRHPAPLRRLVLQRLHPDVASGLPSPKPPVPEQQRLLAELTDFCRDRSEGRDMCAPCACGSRDALPALYRPIGWRARVAGVRAQVSVSEVSPRDGMVMSTWYVTDDDICYDSRINGLDKRRPRFCFRCNFFICTALFGRDLF
jgi:hypothetical protein